MIKSLILFTTRRKKSPQMFSNSISNPLIQRCISHTIFGDAIIRRIAIILSRISIGSIL